MQNQNQNQNQNSKRIIVLLIIGLAVLFLAAAAVKLIQNHKADENVYTYSEFHDDIRNLEVKKISIEQNSEIPTGKVLITFEDDVQKLLFVEDVAAITDELKENGLVYEISDVKRESFFVSFFPLILMIIFFGGIFYATVGKQMGLTSKDANDKKFAKQTKKVTFDNVAGLDEEKAELQEVVNFLKNPDMYTKLGAKIPKGIMLVGPPGTGKTLLARAVAGEADVPFLHISGSEFEEMFVGVGASRVRKLFADAKKKAPCIIFIDEIDAVARKRSFSTSGHDENAQTLNQILVEMDGFEENNNIIIIAATNREDILDPAILRPGRFDRRVFVGNPDVGGREAILKIYAANKPLASDVDLKSIAQTTVGFSGADIENLMNEAAIIAATAGDTEITAKHVEKAFIKVGVGIEKKSKIVSDKDKRITAYHESGHALLFHLLPNIGPVHMVSIVPTGNAGGYTMPLDEKSSSLQSKGMMLDSIKAMYGGRIAEEIIFGDITMGASQDIQQATDLVRAMVVEYGMSDAVAPLNYLNDRVGSDGRTKDVWSESVIQKIDEEAEKIARECYKEAKEILLRHQDVLDVCAKTLLEKEKISREEFEALVDGYLADKDPNLEK